MRLHLRHVALGELALILLCITVVEGEADVLRIRDAHIPELQGHFALFIAEVYEADGKRTVGKGLYERHDVLRVVPLANAVRRAALDILVDADELVVAGAVHTDDEHVNVVVAVRAAERRLIELREEQVLYGFPVILNIARRAEQLCAGASDPAVHVFVAPVAGGEHDISAAVAQCKRHALVEHFAVHVLRFIAVVVLKVIDAPGSKRLGIYELMLKAARVARAGVRAAAGVHAELEALRVHIVRHSLHAMRELLRIRHKAAVFVALLETPAIVDDDVLIAFIFKAACAQSVRCAAHKVFVDVPCKGVP